MLYINKGDLMAKWQTLTYDQKLLYRYSYISSRELDEEFEEHLEDNIDDGDDLDEVFNELESFKNANPTN